MKKVISVSLLIVMLLSLCACSSPEKAIIGTWKTQNTVLGVVTETSYTFNEDGTGVKKEVVETSFTYTISEDKLTIKSTILGIEKTEEYTFEIKKDTLSLTSDNKTIAYTKAE